MALEQITAHASPNEIDFGLSVSAKCIAGVNTDADDIAGLNGAQIEGLQGFVGDERSPIRRWSRRT
jgi:hypothetical protein